MIERQHTTGLAGRIQATATERWPETGAPEIRPADATGIPAARTGHAVPPMTALPSR